MLERLKKIFGLQAAPIAPPQPPAPPAPPAPPPAKPSQKRNIWHLIEAKNAQELAKVMAEDPSLLAQTKQISIGKQGSVNVTPMMYAAYKGAKGVLRLLHEAGADIDHKGDQGLTALHLAARCKKGAGTVGYILSKSTAMLDAQTASGATPLIEAARQGNLDCVKSLLDHGAKTDIAGKHAMPAIVAAAACGHAPVVDALLAAGAPLDTKNDSGRTALWYAAYANHAALAAELIGRGADVKVSDKHGTTLLMGAARLGNIALAQRLVDEGLDVNQCDGNGSTALHYTCFAEGGARMQAVAELLISKGAYVDVKNRNGEIPLDRARQLKSITRQNMIDFMQAKFDDPASPHDPGYLALFTEGTEQRVKAMKALKLKPARM